MSESGLDLTKVTLNRTLRVPKVEPINDESENNEDAESSTSERASPEANCPICLGKPENKSFTDSCLHQFCFKCLLEWSKVKAECPLCKQRFKSIIHNVRSIEDYEQYYLSTAPAESRILGIISYETSQPRETFRYRTTAVSNYIDYFVHLEEAISNHVIPSIPSHSGANDWQRRRQNGTSDFRRNVYQQGLWVQNYRDVISRVRESSPEFYRANPTLIHRLVPWLNRELNVLCRHQAQLVSMKIMELLTQVPIRSSRFKSAVSPYIGRHTEHFVHELYNFATSPFDLIGYDRHSNYVGRDLLLQMPTEVDSDSDVQIVGPETSSPQRSIQLSSESDSDECVVVDSIPAPPVEPEIITLDSEPDDEVVQVNIHIGSEPSRPDTSSRRTNLKRNWLTVNNVQVPTTSSDNLNVSINIAHGHTLPSRSSTPTKTDTSSSSSWSPCWKKLAKTKVKKEVKKKKGKDKSLKSKKQKVKSKPNNRSSSSERSASPVVLPRKKRRTSVVLKTSSEEDVDVLHIKPDHFSSSDESEYKPRIRSVVIKSGIKAEPRPTSSDSHSPPMLKRWDASTSGSRDYDFSPPRSNLTVESHQETRVYDNRATFDIGAPGCSNSSWSDRYRSSYSHRTRTYSTSSSSDQTIPSIRKKYRMKYKRVKKSK